MGIFKRRKNEDIYDIYGGFDYEHATVKQLERRVQDLQFRLDSVRTDNDIRLSVSSLIAMIAMMGIFALTASLPLWLHITLTSIAPLGTLPFTYHGLAKADKIKAELKQAKDYLDIAYIKEEIMDRLNSISEDEPTIKFGSEKHKELMKEFATEEVIEDDNIDDFIL